MAAIFVEPIQGEGGYHVPPPGFLPALRELCDRHGILLVADEVQSGMGRTGKMFAVEHWGVEPDIICLAKGIASGMPLGAIIARDEVMDWPQRQPRQHLRRQPGQLPGRPGHARPAGRRATSPTPPSAASSCAQGLRQLQAEHPDILGDVRGLGLMMAMDLGQGRRPSPARPGPARGRDPDGFRQGLLLLGCGESAIRFCPPLCVTAEQVETALRILGGVLAERRRQLAAV